MSKPSHPLSVGLKVIFGSIAGVYAVLQNISLPDHPTDVGSGDVSYAFGRFVGGLGGLLLGWGICLLLLLTTNAATKTGRLLVDAVKILFALPAGLYVYLGVCNLAFQSQAERTSPGNGTGVATALLIVDVVVCSALLWSAYRRRKSNSAPTHAGAVK